jgi:hypothetical protein
MIQTVITLPDKSSAQLAQAMRWKLNLLDNNQQQEWNNAIREIQNRITKQNPEHIKQQHNAVKNIKNQELWKTWQK